MSTISSEVYGVAESYLGLKEYPGAKQNNPKIVEMFTASGHAWVKDDETPWCSAFVNSVLAQVGIKGTLKLNARSWLSWGNEISLDDAQKGNIVVFWLGSKDSWKGHVAFYSHHDKDYVYVLGGNQGNKVSLKPYARSRLLGVRTYKQPRSKVTQSNTVKASVTQGAAAVTGGLTALSQLEGTTQIITLAGCFLIGALAMFILKDRLRKWAAGDQ